jgi:hypothetical protein
MIQKKPTIQPSGRRPLKNKKRNLKPASNLKQSMALNHPIPLSWTQATTDTVSRAATVTARHFGIFSDTADKEMY